MFMGHTLVVYHNPKRKDTFGVRKAYIVRVDARYAGRGRVVSVNGAVIPSPVACDVREGKVARIDVYME